MVQAYGLDEVHRTSFFGITSDAFNTSVEQYLASASGLLYLSINGVCVDGVVVVVVGGGGCG